MKILKIPGVNGLGRTKGTKNSAEAVIEAIKLLRSTERGKPLNMNLLDVEGIKINSDNLEEQERRIFEISTKEFEKENKILFLGGDHSISYSICRAFLESCRKNRKEPCLIVFDAHLDCMKPMKEPTHEEWLRALIDAGFPSGNVLIVGARNPDPSETVFVSENKIRQMSVNQLETNLEESTDALMEFSSGKELYVSFDIDFIDPLYAPATGYPETGGVTSRQAIYIVSRISLMKNLRAFDLVEIDSENEKARETVKLAAKLAAELL